MTLESLLRVLMSSPTGHRVAYELENGKNAYGFGLLKTQGIAIQRAFMPEGGIFPEHEHKGHEWLIIESGSVKFYVEDRLRILEAGDFVSLQPQVEHSCLMLADTWMIGITIPADPGYPESPIQVNGLANIDAADLAHIINAMPQAQLMIMSEGLKPQIWRIIKETVE